MRLSHYPRDANKLMEILKSLKFDCKEREKDYLESSLANGK